MSNTATILLVDDLEANLIAMAALLQAPGIRLLLARSGAEALEIVLVHEVALALVDVQMPDMDGFELAEAIHKQKPVRPFLIAMTAHTRNLGSNPKAAVFDGFLGKPFSAESLLEQLDKAGGRASANAAVSV